MGTREFPGLEKLQNQWDNLHMNTQTLDSEKRIVLPEGHPGDVFEILPQGEGQFLLVRVEQPARKRMTQEESREAILRSPLSPMMSWEELRQITREP